MFKYLRKLKITYRILIIFQFMMIPTLAIFIVLFFVLHKMQEVNREILIKNLSSIIAAYNVENSLLTLKELRANYILDGERKWLDEFEKEVGGFNFWYNKAFEVSNSEDEKDILSDMSIEFSYYLSAHREIMALFNKGQRKQAINILLTKSMGHYNAIYSGCEQLISTNRNVILESESNLKNYAVKSLYISYGIISGFVLMGVILVYLISRSIIEPIREMEQESDKVMPLVTGKREMDSLKERFEIMVNTLKENQQRLILSERRAAIGEIAAGISHELNNPIGVICGFTEFLLKKKEITEADREFIKDIDNEAQRCKKLLRQLLDFAKTPEPVFVETDIKELINDLLRSFRTEKFSNVLIKTDFPQWPLTVMADPVQMRQVLFNVIMNACEAMNFSGNINISINSNDNYLEIKIADSGTGISDSIKNKIFTPFFSTKTKGVGLGLSVCLDIVEKHHGRIAVEDGSNGGSVFIISIPEGK
ncbi:MAG TPA: ATP-binding protein [Spirochaetota bacterium]|nr:ATP-binding protein [Spirochaetota bacterium]